MLRFVIIGVAVVGVVLIALFWDALAGWIMQLRQPVFVDTSSEQLRAAESALKAQSIPYTLHTVKGRTSAFTRADAANAVQNRSVLPPSAYTGGDNTYVYMITVPKKHREHAKEVLGASPVV